MDMVDETDRHLDSIAKPYGGGSQGEFRTHYDMRSEFVHPSQGSFAVYQRSEGDKSVFERRVLGYVVVADLLSAVRMSAHFLLEEAHELGRIEDLPPSWPPAGGLTR